MGDPQTTKPLARLLRYARPHRRALLSATIYSVLNKLFDLAPPILIGAAVDIVVSRQDSFIARLGYAEVNTQLWILAGLTFAGGGPSPCFSTPTV